MNKKELHIVQGMTRDTYVSQFNPTMVCDARNIRITSMGKNRSLLSVTNEKGPAEFEVTGDPIIGTIIGCSSLNNILTLFTTQDATPRVDRIYKLTFSASDYNSAVSLCLCTDSDGILDFDEEHPIEALSVFENEDIQKVYWVDGKNQPRMVNVAKDSVVSNPDIFNFNRKISGDFTFKVTKYNAGGQFPAGTIQYCFNYFDKFGQETNIVDVSPLYYLSPKTSGLPADAMDSSSFLISIDGVDASYEYVRIYSIVRTSENASPNARIVGDFKISEFSGFADFTPIEGNGVILNPSNIDIVNTITGEVVYALTDRYTIPTVEGTSLDVPIESDECAYDRSTGIGYAKYYKADGTKRNLLTFYFDSDGFKLIRGTQNQEIRSSSYYNTKGISIVDNGIIGSSIDAQSLLFIGGQDIVAGTLSSKDNTLFLGNLKQKVPNAGQVEVEIPGLLPQDDSITSSVKEYMIGRATACVFGIDGYEKTVLNGAPEDENYISGSSYYDYPINNNKSSYDTKSFKAREKYRLGFIAQYNTGQWSEVIWVGDMYETYSPSTLMFYNDSIIKWGPSFRKPGFKLFIPDTVTEPLKEAGFIRVAPVAVYPTNAEREIICQGVLSGTVFNVADRADNSPFAQADWRLRTGYSWDWIDFEIQCNPVSSAPELPIAFDSNADELEDSDFIDIFSTQFYRDPSILSFHSPDIEEDEELSTTAFTNTKLRIVGISNLGTLDNGTVVSAETAAEVKIFTSSEGADPTIGTVLPWRNSTSKSAYKYSILNSKYGNTELSYGGYQDESVLDEVDEDGNAHIATDFMVYKYTTFLWHRSGPLNGQPDLTNEGKEQGLHRTALYSKKLTSELRYARTTFFQPDTSPILQCFELSITSPKVVNNVSSTDSIESSGGDKHMYYGDMDKILVPPFKDIPETSTLNGKSGTEQIAAANGYPIETLGHCGDADAILNIYTGEGIPWEDENERFLIPSQPAWETSRQSYGKDPVIMKYKTQKHLIFKLTASAPEDNTIYQLGNSITGTHHLFWMPENVSMNFVDVLDGKITDSAGEITGGITTNSVFVGELYRTFTEEQQTARFGGTSDEAITNNVWRRCGDSVPLDADYGTTIYFKEGDTYVGRYDCLKSYPYTNEDQNQLVSIYSTELESRVNLDERYDKLRGVTDNTMIRPTNFNLYNHPGYEQSNQFFTYKTVDYDRYGISRYPNLITWSLEKKMGADIDAWTSMHMLSTADLDGKLGEVTKLATFNDTLYGFQPRGVSQILYNERVQIPASDGQPIEITNGLKYGGIRYLSNQIGLTNKWSFCETPLGMYFIDDEKDTLYYFNGQQFQDLSTKAGFRTWLKQNNSYSIWNPKHFSNIRTYYDKVNSDIYFMTKNESLVYSEQLGTFTSFMDYAKLPMVVNMNDGLFTFTKNSDTNEDTAWKFFNGCYNVFFGNYKPYWLTFIANSDSTIDKVFNNLAWRTVDYEGCELKPLQTFDSLRVWNDHQDTGQVTLISKDNKPSILKKKFNVFRVQIPRDKLGNWSGKGLNRIRNPWTYIQLARVEPNTDFMTFQDMEVDFFE